MISASAKRRLLKDFVAKSPTQPVRLAVYFKTPNPAVPTEVGLPDPAAWQWCAIIVPDEACMAWSDGTAWLKYDGSAL